MTQRRKKRKPKLWVLLLIIAVVVLINRSDIFIESRSMLRKLPPIKGMLDSPALLQGDSLHSTSAILVRLQDDRIMLEKNSREKIYPASMTKIMTAIIAIEELPDLKEKVTLSEAMFRELYLADASMAGFVPDESVSCIDLLYGAMLPSGAECCIGLAERIAGSEQEFVKLMNEKAEELGMNSTHFCNSTGLHDTEHYTTVEDLSVLLRYSLRNDTFREIYTASRHSTQPTNRHPGGITFANTMFESLGSKAVDGGEILGGKTGYTEEAGLCLASLARLNGKEYVLVTAGARGNHESEQYNIDDAIAVYGRLSRR